MSFRITHPQRRRASQWRPGGWLPLLALLFSVVAGAAAAQEATPALRAPAIQAWADSAGQATLEQAHAAFVAGQGRAADAREVMPLGRGRAVWYRVVLPAVATPVQAVLTLPIASIDSVELFRRGTGPVWTSQRAGDALPVGEWPVRYLHPAFVLPLQPGAAQPVIYVRVQHSHPISLALALGTLAEFNESNKLWHLLLGGYVGFLLLVVVLAAVHAVLWRDTIHLYYGAHVLLVGMVVLSLTGLAGEYLWPWNAWWNDIAPAVLAATALGGMGLFLREVVAERGRRVLSTLLLGFSVASFLIALGYLWLGRPAVFLLHNINGALSMAVFLVAAGWHALRYPKVGAWVLAGVAALAIGAAFPVTRNLGLEPPAVIAQYGLQLGAALEIPLVFIGLYFRSRERRDNQLRVQGLSRTDPLTGVGSHRVLLDGLEQLLERHRRDPVAGAVLRVRVANLAAIANEYGREAAEAAVVRAAECLTHQAREGDTVAREEGGDLVLVMEGRLTREEALAAGRDLIAAGLKFSGRLPPGVTLSLQVAGACAPLPRSSGPLLLTWLGQVLQQIAADPSGRGMRVVQGAAAVEGEPAATPA